MPTVAVIGASNDRSRFGNKAVRAFRIKRFTVYPVNPSENEVEGLLCYHSIRDLPVRPDQVTVYVRPQILLELLPDIAEKGCDQLWLNPGTASPEVLDLAKRLHLPAIQGCSILAIGVSPSSL